LLYSLKGFILPMNNGKIREIYKKIPVFAAVLTIITLIILPSLNIAKAAHMGTSSRIWGINASSGIADIHEFDPNTDTTTTISRVPTLQIENGRAIAHDGTDLWYTILDGSFQGDGKIHRVATTGGQDIATIPDPYGPKGRGIGALDFDGKYLWAISYLPENNTETIFKISTTGTVLASCDVPFGGPLGAKGADTLAIVNGKVLTDAGELLTKLIEYNLPTSIGGPCERTGKVFTLPFEVTGIDTDNVGNLIATDLITLYNMGTAPYSTIVASQPGAFPINEEEGGIEEDITTESVPKEQPGVCSQNNVQHWDKIIFAIIDPDLAKKVNLTANTELDIKVLDDPHKVADIKQKVIDFLNVPNAPKKAIQILDVEYAIICASQIPSEIRLSIENVTQLPLTSNQTRPTFNATSIEQPSNATGAIPTG
jgi:hypothetical protein